MKTTKLMTLGALAFGISLLAPSSAHAADVGNLLVAACSPGGGGDADAAHSDIMAACGLNKSGADNDVSVCQKVSGTPQACAVLAPTDGSDEDITCNNSSSGMEISAEISTPTGWGFTGKISGTITVKASVTGVKTCAATERNRKAKGGEYVSLKGNASFEIGFNVTGTGTLTGPGGITISVGAGLNCTNIAGFAVYKTNTVQDCKFEKDLCVMNPNDPDCMMSDYGEWVSSDPTDPYGEPTEPYGEVTDPYADPTNEPYTHGGEPIVHDPSSIEP